MNKRLLAAAVAVGLLGFAPAPFPRPERGRGADQTAVAGLWEFELWETRGTSSLDSAKMYHVDMTKEKYDFLVINGGGRTHYDMRLDATKSPAAFDWLTAGQVRYTGSYRLEGDRITMVFATHGVNVVRPTEFNSRAEYRFIMRRIKRN